MRTSVKLCAFMLLIWLQATAAAQVKSYMLHTSSHVDEISVAAVNSKTGDILVVWTENIASTTNQRLWAATLKRKAGGKYKVGKAVALTPAGSFAHNPVVAFNEAKQRFLIVYGVGEQPTRLESRLVKRTRIASKSRFLFEDKYASSGTSMALAGVVKNSKLPSSKALFILARDIRGDVFADSGVFLIMLDKKGAMKDDPILLRDNDFTGGYTSAGEVSDMEIAGNGTIYIALQWNSQPSGGSNENYLGILAANAQGIPIDTVAAESTSAFLNLPKIALLKSGMVLCSWRVGDDKAVYNQRFGAKLGLLGSKYSPFSVEQKWYEFGLVSDDYGTAYLFDQEKSEGVLYRLKPSGASLDTKRAFKIPVARTTWYPMAYIPGRNQLLLVTNRTLDGNKTAMMAHVISLNQIFH